ncbi:MAG: transglycosylase SLT domain-containing protein [Anaerolineales bacterium]|nr:transglycosylase SLT domain-containing protein [Anaerolineales bacterium]
MNFGPRLIIPGAILGSLFLATFLFMVTDSNAFQAAAAPGTISEGSIQPKALDEQAPIVHDTHPTNSTINTDEGKCNINKRYPERITRWCELITHYAQMRDLSPDLVAALIWQESGGNPEAYSSSGAVGLMQIMPRDGLAASFICVNGPCFQNRPTMKKLKDPEFNIKYGTRMLSHLLAKHGSTRDALKAYGPMNVGYYYAEKVLGIYNNYRRQ